MAKRPKFEYIGEERTEEDVTRRANAKSGTYDSYLVSDVQMFKAKEGENTVRILPGTWSKKDVEKWGNSWEITMFWHNNVGPDNSSYLCLQQMKGENCPVCEAARQSTDPEEARELRAKKRPLVWVIDRANEKAGPMVWTMPFRLWKELNARSHDKKRGLLKVDHPEDGYDITFTREGTDKRTDYSALDIDRDPSPIHAKETLQEKWLDYILDNPLPELLNFYDYAHIEKVLTGGAAPKRDEEPEEEEATPRRRKLQTAEPEEEEEVKPRRARRGEPEEEEEERPTRSRRGKGNGEEEPEEEDDDPPPRRGARAGRSTGESDDDDAGEEREETPSRQARRQLERLRDRVSK